MALPMPSFSIVDATILVYLTLSLCLLSPLPVRSQGLIGAAANAAAGVSQGVNNAAAGMSKGVNNAAAGVSQGVRNAAVGVIGAAAGAVGLPGGSRRQPGQTPGSNATNPGHRGTSPRPGVPVARAGEFLAAHNKARAGVNEPPMSWDVNLARYARRFAAKRAGDCKMLHSYGPYGENIFWGEKDVWSPTQVVQSWVSENKYYDRANNACAAGQMCGHYTQIVWVDSTKVGCAMVTCLNGGMYTICNYDPPGNYVNESPFVPFKGNQ